MKRLIIMAALTVAAFGFNQANAQKVIKDAAGNVYIDVQDMPAGTFSNSSLNSVAAVTDAGNSVFKKLQIAKADLPTKITWAEACGLNTTYNASAAIGQAQGAVNTGCKAYNEGGVTGWRVPTQKESVLMYVLKDLLAQMGVGALVRNGYWISIEGAAGYSWYVSFSTGSTASINKTNPTIDTRCVREVTN